MWLGKKMYERQMQKPPECGVAYPVLLVLSNGKPRFQKFAEAKI